MQLKNGQRLGPYEVLATLGAGGMGEVYRARDTRLNRDVAIKILPELVASDPSRRSRFEREAQAVAALNHPNIVSVYDVGDNYIVSELVEGETLRALIREGPVPPRRLIEIAAQIAEGLAAAHAAGIIHRDVKPENVMITRDGRIKILDFGLARQETRSSSTADDPTATLALTATEPGMIVGTVSYMSPEQVRARPLDHRSDIFSLGVVLHEMLSGVPPFRGASTVEVMNAVLKDDPPELPDSAPPGLGVIIRHCLSKEPETRFQSASDLAFALRTASGSSIHAARAGEPRTARRWLRFAGIAALAAVCATAAWKTGVFARTESPAPWVLTRLTYDTGLTTDPAISPDGKLVAYSSDRAGDAEMDIWVQHLSGGSAIRLTKDPGDEIEPDFSPDGGRVVFRSNRDGGGIYIVPVLGGEPRLIVKGGHRPRFSPDGTMIAYWTGALGSALGSTARHVYVTPVSGSGPANLISGERDAAFPVWSPNGRRLIFAATGFPDADRASDWYIADVDGRALRPLKVTASFTSNGLHPFASPPGRWMNGDVVLAGRNLEQNESRLWRLKMSLEGTIGPLESLTNGTGSEDLPAAGTSGPVAIASLSLNSDVWMVDADVNNGKTKGEPVRVTQGPAMEVRVTVSGDGGRIAYLSNRAGNQDAWLKDLRTGIESAITATPSDEQWPVLSGDGSSLLYKAGVTAYLVRLPRGLPEKIHDNGVGAVWELSADSRYALIAVNPPDGRARFQVFETSTREPVASFAHPTWAILSPRSSRDAKWMAFHVRSNEFSRRIYAAPFRPGHDPPESEWVSITDGTALDRDPAWSPDGTLVYYLTDRDGFRCIAATRVEGKTKQPKGEMFYVKHLHSASRTMLVFSNTGLTAVSLTRDKMFFVLGERTGNIWLMKPPSSEPQ